MIVWPFTYLTHSSIVMKPSPHFLLPFFELDSTCSSLALVIFQKFIKCLLELLVLDFCVNAALLEKLAVGLVSLRIQRPGDFLKKILFLFLVQTLKELSVCIYKLFDFL